MIESLSIAEARKLVLLSQWLPWVKPEGRALAATLAAVRHLGYVQIDTISVVERAHHHTLWSRSRRYQPQHLERLLEEKSIFEYWSHAAAYLPMDAYRFSLPQMHAYANGKQHWYTPDRKLMRRVLARITAEGPLRAQDFEDTRSGAIAVWSRKPAKQALEQLFMEGRLMTLRRQGFQKVYDLTERVLGPDTDTRMPSESEYGCFLITRYLQTNGLGRAPEIAYLRSGLKPLIEDSMTRMARRGEIIPVKVKDRLYHALPASLELLGRPLSRQRLKILSPFDNLLIQRERMQFLFDFDYQIECYTPASKRKHGYFSLPLLWRGKLVARMDCKAERKTQVLVIRNLVCEPGLTSNASLAEAFANALADELQHFVAFNSCQRVEVEKLPDKSVQRCLKAALKAYQS